ncbi:C2H2-type domain-containing protein [Pseudoscourfieldia marina]
MTWSSSSSDDDYDYGYDVLDLSRVQTLAANHNYSQTQLEYGEGVVAFRRMSGFDENAELVRVWWRTGTVGTYLKHPRHGKTQLFRRNVDNMRLLGSIFANPRTHTGQGYYRNNNNTAGVSGGTSTCPACGRVNRSILGTVQHFEDGHCPQCPNPAAARQTVFNVCQLAGGASFAPGQLRLTNGASSGGSSSYVDGAHNYRCTCGRTFVKLMSYMQHVQASSRCTAMSSGGAANAMRALSYY